MQSGQREEFIVNSDTFGSEGKCFRKVKEDKFIIFNRQERCYKCLKVWKRHENFYAYKLGACNRRQGKTTQNCNIIPESPFRFGVCPENVQTEDNGNLFYGIFISLEGDPIETLTCKAVWSNALDENERYMVGTLDYRYKRTPEERVRCFLVKETKRGIQVAQSENSSCTSNLHSSIAGYRTLKLNRVERKSEPSCVYPDWAREMDQLLSFSLSSIYQFSEDGSVLSLSNYSVTTNR